MIITLLVLVVIFLILKALWAGVVGLTFLVIGGVIFMTMILSAVLGDGIGGIMIMMVLIGSSIDGYRRKRQIK